MEMDVGLLVGVIGLLVCLFLTVFGLLVYSGLFHSIEVRAGRPPFEGVHIAYKFARGPYKNAGSIFTEVHNWAPTLKCIGLYYDDPNEVAQSDLRYVVGAILSEGDSSNDDSTNLELANLLVEKGYKLTRLPAVSHAVTTTFPFKNTLSIFLAVARVYPRITEYVKERKLCAHPMIEIYDEDVIHFVAPLAKQDEFYVPEATEDHSDEENVSEAPLPTKSRSSEDIAEAETKSGSRSNYEEEEKVKEVKVGSNGSEDDSTASSFEELHVDSESK